MTKKSNEVVHTQAKAMSEHDVIYKYVSKNLLFVANVAPKAIGEIGLLNPEESWLVVYLIDTVTGRILHRVTHHGSQGPVHAVFSENWVVYHYFNLKAHRYEMSFIEIYDQSQADNKGVWKLVLGKHNLTSPISSYSRPEVATKSQTYFFTHSVKTIAVTSTAEGITSKQLLIGTIIDQVLALEADSASDSSNHSVNMNTERAGDDVGPSSVRVDTAIGEEGSLPNLAVVETENEGEATVEAAPDAINPYPHYFDGTPESYNAFCER